MFNLRIKNSVSAKSSGMLFFLFLIVGVQSCSIYKKTLKAEEQALSVLANLEQNLVREDLSLNAENAQLLQEKSKQFLVQYPNSKHKEQVLVYIAKTSDGLNQNELTLQTLNQLIKEFPDSEQTPLYYYNKGKVLEDKLKQKQKAITVYKELIKRYPDSKIAQEIKLYLKYIEE